MQESSKKWHKNAVIMGVNQMCFCLVCSLFGCVDCYSCQKTDVFAKKFVLSVKKVYNILAVERHKRRSGYADYDEDN